MVDFKLTNASSPTLFTVDGYQLVVMPMLTTEATEQQKAEAKAKQAEPTEPVAEQAEPEAEAITEAVTEAEAKLKRSRKREPVTVT